MPARTMPLGLAAASLLLAGCAGAHAIAPSQKASPATANPPSSRMSIADMPGMNMTPALPPPGTPTASAAAAGKPTAAALMICSSDIKAKVKQALTLPGQPPTISSFANPTYTCTYQLPVGPLVLSVQHAATKAAADQYYGSVKATLGPTDVLYGLGEKAYGSATGITVVLKDNDTLVVDARRLPAVFGSDQQKRTDLANEIASDVLGCWTGD